MAIETGGRRIGLAFGGGAARGLAHIGVLEVLEEEGIPVDMISGTSAGAVVGALYAQGKDARLIKELALEVSRKRLASLADITLSRSGFIQGRRIKHLMARAIGADVQFSDLKIPFACVATDLMTGEEIVISYGSVLEAVRASISVPGVFTLARWKGRYLVDGGLVNPVPARVLRDMGADFVIAVNVMPDVSERESGLRRRKQPGIISIMVQSMYIASHSLIRSGTQHADVVIQPKLPNISFGDFRKAEECIARGAQAAREALPEIRSHLEL
jgi:NTE family protein